MPSPDVGERIVGALDDPKVIAGNFRVRFEGSRLAARFMTSLYPRLRFFRLSYGDSAIFVLRAAYEQVRGFKPFPIFEDLDLMKRLRKRSGVVHLTDVVIT